MEPERFDLKKLVRRSKLYVPANREKFIAKAWTRGADCVILDLEDAVAPVDKASARKMIWDLPAIQSSISTSIFTPKTGGKRERGV
jgi:malate synthase